MSDVYEPGVNPQSSLNIEELLVASAFSHAVTGLRLVETHISWIVLTGELAYKIKKPLKLDFIDTSTLERRQHYCNEELLLNRRLAPQLYLRVVPITRQNGRVLVDGPGTAIEYAVCLKQFSGDEELPALLECGDVSVQEILQLGETLAHFHMQAPAASGSRASEEATQRLYDTVLDNLEQLLAHIAQDRWMPELRRLWNWTSAAIVTDESSFEERARSGHIRDCHGDLHAANIVRIDGRLVPFDCIDFDPHLRWIDVTNDIAFLVMDLQGRGREDLAMVLLNRYLEVTGDYEGVRLLPFYAVYRALVRAKVDALTIEQAPRLADEFSARLQRRIRTAISLTQRPRPALLLMHGLSGSGKSWLSEQLVAPLKALRIRSDVERRRLAGTSQGAAGFKQGRYSPEMSHRVYARLMECAESCLQADINVIVDAAFLDESDQELFTSLADRLNVTCAFISCHADPATLLNRVAARSERGTDASEANTSVLDAQLRDFKPLGTQQRRPFIQVDTRNSDVIERTVGAVRTLLVSE
jgi:aminoglycoside phosphotransferase family enzyme/predicted kinase